MRLVEKFQRRKMDGDVVGPAIDPNDLVVGEVMEVNREDSVHSAYYPCQTFMAAAGILQDFNTLISNAGLENFTIGEPAQFVKLTMSVVQDFRFTYSSDNPMVHYKIYNIPMDISLYDFCTAIKVPYWGSYAKINGQPRHLVELYSEITKSRGLLKEGGKIRLILFPAIRYFTHFIAKCVLARKNANKLSVYDLAFISAALRSDRTYNLGALIAHRLSTNREKGGVCGGLIASRLLAYHQLVPHPFDIELPVFRLDINSMIRHHSVPSWATLDNLTYNLVFVTKSRIASKTSERLVCLPAPVLFNLDGRENWAFSEEDLDAYMREHGPRAEPEEERPEPHDEGASSSYQFDYASGTFPALQSGSYEHARDDAPSWSYYQHP
jgi:hypothetical protein